MDREPENEERTPEAGSQNRRNSGDELDTTQDQMGASGTGSSKGGGRDKKGESQGDGSADSNSGDSRPSESQGDERERTGTNKEPAGSETS